MSIVDFLKYFRFLEFKNFIFFSREKVQKSVKMSVPIHAFDTVPIRSDLRANRDSGDVILDADGEYFSFKSSR